jgi:hypothetical protein
MTWLRCLDLQLNVLSTDNLLDVAGAKGFQTLLTVLVCLVPHL